MCVCVCVCLYAYVCIHTHKYSSSLLHSIYRDEGEAFGAYHSYGEEKVVAFTEYINYALDADRSPKSLNRAVIEP